MAGEIIYDHSATGATLYVVLECTDNTSANNGKYWNGTAWEAKAAANWGDYDIALTEGTGNYQYTGNMPAAGATVVTVRVFTQAGGSPAITDTQAAALEYVWTGTVLLSAAKLLEAAVAVLAGNSTFTESTGAAVYKKADGSTTGVSYTVSDVGTRTGSTLS